MRVRIRQLDERVATNGLHFGIGPAARRLEPGEVVDIPEGDFFDTLWNTGKIELTRDPVTRPLEYENQRQARLCSPSYRPRGDSDEIERDKALARVSQLLEESTEVASTPVTAVESPATQPQTEYVNPVPPELPPEAPEVPVKNRRAARRARAISEQETIT